MHIEDIEYSAEGLQLLGHLAFDETRGGVYPAILVAHEGGGLTNHAKGRAEQLAQLGYIAFALDYFGGGKPLPMEEMQERVGALMQDPDATRRLGKAGLDVLLAQPSTDPDRVGAIGFCFGGMMVLELARNGADLKAVVGFHAALGTSRPDDARNISGSVLVCMGVDDPFVPAEQRKAFEQEMSGAGVDWQMHVYGDAGHSFTNDEVDRLGIPGLAYHRRTDERSWRAMLNLFDETLGPP